MQDYLNVLKKIADLKSRVAKDSISPPFLGNILEDMLGYMILVNNSDDVHALRIEFDTGGDNFIQWGETKHIRCNVFDIWVDVTDAVTSWKIERETGDAVDDAAWGLRQKAREFAGEIDIVYSKEENDLGSGTRAVFHVTAELKGGSRVRKEIEI